MELPGSIPRTSEGGAGTELPRPRVDLGAAAAATVYKTAPWADGGGAVEVGVAELGEGADGLIGDDGSEAEAVQSRVAVKTARLDLEI